MDILPEFEKYFPKCIIVLFSKAKESQLKVSFFKALANGGIFSVIFLGISVEMVLAGLRDGYSWEFQGYPSLKPASTISTDIPRNIPGNILPLARTLRKLLRIFLGIFLRISFDIICFVYYWRKCFHRTKDIPRNIPRNINSNILWYYLFCLLLKKMFPWNKGYSQEYY